MKELIESTKKLQGDIDKCISNLIHARQYHDKIEEAGAMFDMERLLVASAQQLQCVVERLEGIGSTIEWQTGEPKEDCTYLATFEYEDAHKEVCVTSWSAVMRAFRHYDDGARYTLAWCKLSDIEPYKEEKE